MRYALITGASSGIGLALAEALARRGRSLILVARERPALEAIAGELAERFNVEVLFRTCDLTEQLQVSGLLLELEQYDYQVDLLVNCAGIASAGSFSGHGWQAERKQLELNVIAVTRLCHALSKDMARNGGGQILNVASVAAFQPGPWLAGYSASKAYVLSLSEALREELFPLGIYVSVLCPGPVDTPFWTRSHLSQQALAGTGWMMPAHRVAEAAMHGLDRRKALIVPGWQNQLLLQALRLTPRWLARRLAGRLLRQIQA